MSEHRGLERERCFAQVLLPAMGAYGYISDINLGGMLVRIPGGSPEPPDGKQEITVSLEELAIPAFSVEAEPRWTRREVKSTLIGFKIVACSGEEAQTRLALLIEHYRSIDPNHEGIVVV